MIKRAYRMKWLQIGMAFLFAVAFHLIFSANLFAYNLDTLSDSNWTGDKWFDQDQRDLKVDDEDLKSLRATESDFLPKQVSFHSRDFSKKEDRSDSDSSRVGYAQDEGSSGDLLQGNYCHVGWDDHDRYFNGDGDHDRDDRFHHPSPNPVSIPSTALLFGSALAFLIGMRNLPASSARYERLRFTQN